MKLVAKTLYGLEKVLGEEIIKMGASEVETGNRAILFKGDKSLLYRVNYCARTALSVLMTISEFRIRSKEDLYNGGSKIEWDRYMNVDDTFSIAPVVNSIYFSHTGYAGLILKDAIADYFRKKTGKRPSVNTEDPALLINLHISNDLVTISIDSSVIPLFKRGYRQEQGAAPLNEVLAAGILLISGWNASATLTDPMCGSGTIPIEAGLIACKVPPGKFRKFFGFQRWKDFDDELFEKIKREADSKIEVSPVKIYGSDISEKAVQQAKSNIAGAGLSDVVSIEMSDFKYLKAENDSRFLFLNPPYGQRLQPDEIDTLYSMIGTSLKHNFPGATAWLITSNKECLKNIGLKPAAKYTLFNGALECVLVKYEMYEGTKKHKKL
ncbi:MAG: THUMP domain-containing protein [Bacteroidales bacterium]|nr:THUMP domain-containing protein [Bacteroidales bacterium]